MAQPLQTIFFSPGPDKTVICLHAAVSDDNRALEMFAGLKWCPFLTHPLIILTSKYVGMIRKTQPKANVF